MSVSTTIDKLVEMRMTTMSENGKLTEPPGRHHASVHNDG